MRSGYFLTKADFLPADDGIVRPSDEEAREIIYDLTGERYSVERVRGGTFHFIFRAQIDKKILFLKITRYRELISSLRVEEYLYRSGLTESGIGVEILGSNFEDKPGSLSYILLREAKGICLRDIEFSDPAFSRMVEEAGRVLATLHECTSQIGFGLIDPTSSEDAGGLAGSQATWNDYIFLNLNKHLDYLDADRGIDPRILRQAGEILRKSSQLLEYKGPGRLLHGDPGSHNIFIDPENTRKPSSFIDWEDALLGDPVFDIAAFASFYRMHEFIDSFLEGYGSINPELRQGESFLRRVWLYYLRIVLAKGVLRFKLGYDSSGNSRAVPRIELALENLA